jgi:hypothetical protein
MTKDLMKPPLAAGSPMEVEQIDKLCAEAMQANADKLFSTKCQACGKSYERSLGWLQKEKFKCPSCGGKLDEHLLHEITLSILRKFKKTPKARQSHVEDKPSRSPVRSRIPVAKDFQLVLQFCGDSLQDLDAIVALEDQLVSTLGDSADVDGHDVGSGQANIFIFTTDPSGTFTAAKPVLKAAKMLDDVVAAYRDVNDEAFTVIWPSGYQKRFALL